MDWLDISVPVGPETPIFEGDPPFRRELAAAISRGDVCNVSHLDFGAHTGTHVDAPSHFIEGAPATDTIPLDALVGPAWVVDATGHATTIDVAGLARLPIPEGEQRLLFKTAAADLWSEGEFSKAFVGLSGDAATALVERGVRLVGSDYLSVAPFGDPAPTHRALLDAGVVILEGLDLRAIPPGPYDLVCLPLRLVGSDGAPARAILRPRSATSADAPG
ncbi:MAG TPA: cyclase family protein [Candidatus Limnocylindrales bacterium]